MDATVKKLLRQVAEQRLPRGGWETPAIFDMSDANDAKALAELLESGQVAEVVDEIELVLAELYDIEYPEQKDARVEEDWQRFLQEKGELDTYGRWVYFGWDGRLVHFPEPDDWLRVRTSRNRDLVTAEEQQVLADKHVMVCGLSVGSNVIDLLSLQGIGGQYSLVDLDSLDPSNLNRIRADYAQIGLSKVEVVARRLSQLDPFVVQHHYDQGLQVWQLETMLDEGQPDVVVDEVDDLKLKVLLRIACRQRGIPVIMATDDGDDVLVDVERYDVESDLPILHGRLPDNLIELIVSETPLSRAEAGMIIGSYFVGSEYVPLRMIESLARVGKTLPSWPQLGGAAVLAGVLMAYCAKRILLGQPLRSGRHLVGPDIALNPQLDEPEYQQALARAREQLDGGVRQ